MVQVPPIDLSIDITDVCNLKCLMCGWSKSTGYFLPFEHFARWLESAHDRLPLSRVNLRQWAGEPTMHPQFVDMAELVKRHDVAVHVVTNGTRLVHLPSHVWRTGRWVVYVSIDAGRKGLYERIRRGAEWQEVWAGVRTVTSAGNKDLRAVCNFLLMSVNDHSLQDLIPLAADAGFDAVAVRPMSPRMARSRDYGELLTLEYDEARTLDAVGRAKAVAEEHGIALDDQPVLRFLGKPARCPRSVDEKGCAHPFRSVYIHRDGGAGPCSGMPSGLYGSAFEKDMVSLYYSEEAKTLRRDFSAGQVPQACEGCTALRDSSFGVET